MCQATRFPTILLTGRTRAAPPDRRSPALQEAAVKELNLEEVLRIAGGVPVTAALDEVTYRTPQEQPADPVDYAHLLGLFPRGSEPA